MSAYSDWPLLQGWETARAAYKVDPRRHSKEFNYGYRLYLRRHPKHRCPIPYDYQAASIEGATPGKRFRVSPQRYQPVPRPVQRRRAQSDPRTSRREDLPVPAE